jgi:adenosine kinase
MPVLIAFGNPLLDISIQISDESILHDFDLNQDDQGEISIEKLQKIIFEAKKR